MPAVLLLLPVPTPPALFDAHKKWRGVEMKEGIKHKGKGPAGNKMMLMGKGAAAGGQRLRGRLLSRRRILHRIITFK